MAHGCGWISDDNSSSSEGEEEEITHDIRTVINGRRPPIDLAYEDKLPYDHGFDGRSIYPWSLDGMNKQQILNFLASVGCLYRVGCSNLPTNLGNPPPELASRAGSDISFIPDLMPRNASMHAIACPNQYLT